jgi:hypothetical protein
VISQKGQTLDIHAARRHIRGHHNLHALPFKAAHDLVARRLREIALRASTGMPMAINSR